jgi:hypothetical protein
MNYGLIILYFLAAFDIVYCAYKHGEQKDDYNIFVTIFTTIIVLVLIWWAVGWRFI